MAGAGELQTIQAAFGVAALAWEAACFLKKIKDADSIARAVHDKIALLSDVLDVVLQALRNRDENVASPTAIEVAQIRRRIGHSIESCGVVLQKLRDLVGGFDKGDQRASVTSLANRVKVAFRHPAICQLQGDLEAHINILQTSLSVLQLYDQGAVQSSLGSHQDQLLKVLRELGARVDSGNALLNRLLHHQASSQFGSGEFEEHDNRLSLEASDSSTLESLANCIRGAEDVHERYTSEHCPDDRSIVQQARFRSAQLSSYTSPNVSRAQSPPRQTTQPDSASLEGCETPGRQKLPLKLLNNYIASCRRRADNEADAGRFTQAEINLNKAAQYSEDRETQHGVKFGDRVQLNEDLAVIYQKQGKWGEAVARLNLLLREGGRSVNGDGENDVKIKVTRARHHQILASVYFDRHSKNIGDGLSLTTLDIDNAEKYAMNAYTELEEIMENKSGQIEDSDGHQACMQLLVRILEARDKTVEASVFKQYLAGDSTESTTTKRASIAGYSIRSSTTDYELVEDRHGMLISAIKAGDNEQIQNLTSCGNVDIHRLCRQDKTLLMHAVESSDVNNIAKLLDPNVGADIETTNKRGLTALHVAAALGNLEMVHSLLQYDAEKEAKDKRGETPLMKAVQAGHTKVIEMLFDNGAEMQTTNVDEWCLLHYAIRQPVVDVTKLLLNLAPELKDSIDQAGKTALHHCADLVLIDQATTLLQHKNQADVNAIDSCSRTPLSLAASKPAIPKREAVVNLLLEHGAKVDEARLPRLGEYAALRKYARGRRSSSYSRHDSVNSVGTVGTTSTGFMRITRVLTGKSTKRS